MQCLLPGDPHIQPNAQLLQLDEGHVANITKEVYCTGCVDGGEEEGEEKRRGEKRAGREREERKRGERRRGEKER